MGFGMIWALSGQAPEPAEIVLINQGKPMKLSFSCTEDDIQWAGMSCSEQEPCPVYLEISSVESVGNQLFVAGNIHSAITTLYSVLLSSADGGKTWREPHERLRGCALDRIQFVGFEAGWISGQLVYPLARDPFFLISSDGGKTWRQRPVFEESRIGSIQQFLFDSQKRGDLLIDHGPSGEPARYAAYESPNGGETWIIRETGDRPIRIKRVIASEPDWRIHAEAATKSFHIQKRQGQRWNTVASFLVPIGSCKPAERQEAPPPAEVAAEPVRAAPVPAPARPSRRPSLKRPGTKK